jgi:hypothetical protein
MSELLRTVSRVPAGEFLPLFSRAYMKEVLGKNRFARYMGTEDSDPIQYKMELKGQGESIQFNFLRALDDNGVAGDMILEGTEVAPVREKMILKWEFSRNAIAAEKSSERKSIIELLPQVKDRLSEWSMRIMRYRVVDAMHMAAPDKCFVQPKYTIAASKVLPGYPALVQPTTYIGPTAAETLAWLTNNQDRVLFGLNDASYSTTNLATALGNASAATDGLTVKLIQKMHDRTKNSSPYINPLRWGDEDETYFVLFCDTVSFRQLQADPTMQAANQYARAREGEGWKKNPIRTGSDLEYDGVIIREIPDMQPIVNDGGVLRQLRVGDSAAIRATARGVSFMTGAQGIAVGIAQEPKFENQDTDYKFRNGVAIEEAYSVNKFQRQDLSTLTKYVDHGSVTSFTNANA